MNCIPNYKALTIYLIPILACWMPGFSLLYLLGYQESFIALNQHFYGPMDWFMLDTTFIGNGIVLIGICILLFVRRHPEVILLTIISLLISGLIVWLCKFLFFADWNRPPMVFNGKQTIHTVGTYRLLLHSFPSGHSVAVAGIFTVLVTAFESYSSILLCSLLTILISYTRIYTGVHFLGDVVAGSVLGTVTGILVLRLGSHRLHRWYEQQNFRQRENWRRGLVNLAGILLVICTYENFNSLMF